MISTVCSPCFICAFCVNTLENTGLSASVITRLTAEWNADYERWQKRDLSARRLSMCGRTVSTCRRGWKTMPNACWS